MRHDTGEPCWACGRTDRNPEWCHVMGKHGYEDAFLCDDNYATESDPICEYDSDNPYQEYP